MIIDVGRVGLVTVAARLLGPLLGVVSAWLAPGRHAAPRGQAAAMRVWAVRR